MRELWFVVFLLVLVVWIPAYLLIARRFDRRRIVDDLASRDCEVVCWLDSMSMLETGGRMRHYRVEFRDTADKVHIEECFTSVSIGVKWLQRPMGDEPA